MDFTWNDSLKLVAVIPSMIFAARAMACVHCLDNLHRFIVRREPCFLMQALCGFGY